MGRYSAGARSCLAAQHLFDFSGDLASLGERGGGFRYRIVAAMEQGTEIVVIPAIISG